MSLDAVQERRLAALVAVYPVADELAARVAGAGHELFLVGGTVRDTLLERAGTDLDFATSMAPPVTEALLRGWADAVWTTGARFGTVSARKDGWRLELTTFRSDAYTPGSRHPDVTFDGDILTDLSRRDFTVNAMAVQVPQLRFVDPFGGLGDLRGGLLRTPLSPELSFGDDPLRMVRLARFVATLGLDPDDGARKAATAMAAQLDTVSRERVRDELSRLLMGAHAVRGLDLLCETRLADRIVPELPALAMERDPLHHHKDVYAHTMEVLRSCPPDDLVLRLAALLHDIGKPATRAYHADGRVSFHHHEVVGTKLARARLRTLRYPREVIDPVCDLVFLHLRFHGYSEGGWTDSAVRRYVRDAGSPAQLERLNQLTRFDVTTRNPAKARRLALAMDELEARIAALKAREEIEALRPPLDGNDIMDHLGLAPGPEVGAARRALLEARIDRGPLTREEGYRLLDEWASARGLTPPAQP